MEKETIIYNGYRFNRYPNAKRLSDQRYYRGWIEVNNEWVKTTLHRYIWTVNNGEIPKGYHIHHKDGNFLNNTLENFECITCKEHISSHYHEQSDEVKKYKTDILLTIGQERAKEWHKSSEGREWHKKNYLNALGKAFIPVEKECNICNKKYLDKSSHKGTKFCSNNCKSAFRRKLGVDNTTRYCIHCNIPFVCNKYSKSKTCSRKCGQNLRFSK